MQIVNTNPGRLNTHSYLNFERVFSESTGVMQNKKVAEYHFCKITVYDSGIILFAGSIHKLYNSLKNVVAPNYNKIVISSKYKGFNGTQFAFDNIIEVQDHLCWLFDCTPNQMIVKSIELGVNTELNFNPQLFLTGLLYHKNILFEYRFYRSFAQVEHKQFIVKIYNKSKQYGMVTNVMRYEIKFNKMLLLKSVGIKTFADITPVTLLEASKILVKRFNEVVYYDNTIFNYGLTKTQLKALDNYSNPRYWIDKLKPNHRFRHLVNLSKIINSNSENIHQIIRNEIVKKCSMNNQLSEKAECSINNRLSKRQIVA